MQTIYIEPDEELTGVLDKIKKEQSSAPGMLSLVFPKNSQVLQSIVNLKLMKRAADQADAHITIITSDKIGRNLASRAGLMVAKAIGETPESPSITDLGGEGVSNVKQEIDVSEDEVVKVKIDEEPVVEKQKENLFNAFSKKLHKKQSKKKDSKTEHKIKTQEVKEKSSSRDSIIEQKQAKRELGTRERFKPKKSGKKLHLLPAVNKKILALFGGGVLIVVVLVFVFVLPRADITVIAKSEPATVDLALRGRNVGEVNVVERIVPAEVITQESSKEEKVTATGKKETGAKAKGSVTIVNEASSEDVVIAAGTVLTTSGGLKFITDSAVTVPGATISGGEIEGGTAAVGLTAQALGAEYNIEPTTLAIAGQASDIYAQNSSAFTGGSKEEVTVISQEDIDKAAENWKNDLITTGKDILSGDLSEGQIIPDGAVTAKVVTKNANPAVGAEANDFVLKVEMVVYGYAVWTQDLKNMATAELENKMSDDKRFIPGQEPTISYEITSIDVNKSAIDFTYHYEQVVMLTFDENEVKEQLRGKDENEARFLLVNLEQVQDATVKLWPFWVKSVPGNSDKIKIKFDI
ncbi:hypothetical protein ACFL1U_02375 [Patescibacteria group bacterium]